MPRIILFDFGKLKKSRIFTHVDSRKRYGKTTTDQIWGFLYRRLKIFWTLGSRIGNPYILVYRLGKIWKIPKNWKKSQIWKITRNEKLDIPSKSQRWFSTYCINCLIFTKKHRSNQTSVFGKTDRLKSRFERKIT